MNLSLLYSDDDFLICEKPAGVSSESPGLPEMVRSQCGFPVFPVHRLDRITGGAIVLARTSRACAALQQLFLSDRVKKEYLAVVSGVPDSPSGSFTDLLYHDQRSNKTFVVDKPRKGVKEAFCEWAVLQTEESPEGPLSLVRVSLHTGRTHQIRVQFASRHMPLAGDRRYGSRVKSDVPALWSARISFSHPIKSEKAVDVSSAPPPSFPWSLFSL